MNNNNNNNNTYHNKNICGSTSMMTGGWCSLTTAADGCMFSIVWAPIGPRALFWCMSISSSSGGFQMYCSPFPINITSCQQDENLCLWQRYYASTPPTEHFWKWSLKKRMWHSKHTVEQSSLKVLWTDLRRFHEDFPWKVEPVCAGWLNFNMLHHPHENLWQTAWQAHCVHM